MTEDESAGASGSVLPRGIDLVCGKDLPDGSVLDCGKDLPGGSALSCGKDLPGGSVLVNGSLDVVSDFPAGTWEEADEGDTALFSES